MLLKMSVDELQTAVQLEFLILAMIAIMIIAAFKSWKFMFLLTCIGAGVTLFSVWTPIMALASMCVCIPASLLLWLELNTSPTLLNTKTKSIVQNLYWMTISLGILTLILKNIHNILGYMH